MGGGDTRSEGAKPGCTGYAGTSPPVGQQIWIDLGWGAGDTELFSFNW